VAGLALVVSEMDQDLTNQLMELNIPVVFYDVGEARKNIANITVNYAIGIAEVVNYLYELGHQRMALVSHHSSLGPLGTREQAFRETVEKFAPAVQWRVASSTDTLDGGRKAARELLNSGLDPTAIMCVNDFMALGVMRELRESGIQVPADISVTGFDNISLAEISNPALSTLNIPREKIGEMMADALTSGAPMPSTKFVIEPDFIIRGTTGRARTAAFQTPALARVSRL